MGGGLGGFLQRIERAGADVAIDDAEGAERCCEGEWAWMAGGDGGRTGHWQDPQGRCTAPRRIIRRARSSVSVRRHAENYHGMFCDCWGGRPLWGAVSGNQARFADRRRLGAGDTKAGSREIRPGLLRAAPADRADVQTVSLGEGLGYAGFHLRGEAGENGERGSDERSNSNGRKCLDHDGPLSLGLRGPSFRCELTNQPRFPAVFAKSENGFVPPEFCFVVHWRTKHCRFAKETPGPRNWFIDRRQIKTLPAGEPSCPAGPPGGRWSGLCPVPSFSPAPLTPSPKAISPAPSPPSGP